MKDQPQFPLAVQFEDGEVGAYERIEHLELNPIIDAVPLFNWKQHPHSAEESLAYLLSVIAASEIVFARRPRINPRVVKVKMSNFARKNKTHRGKD